MIFFKAVKTEPRNLTDNFDLQIHWGNSKL